MSQPASILVVDDTPDNVRLLSTLLTNQGYEVRKAINGSMALKSIAAAKPDLVLLDIGMPGLDGYQVCQQIKTDPQTQDIPVIFVSALGEALDKVMAFDVGGADYITKPFQQGEVLARVNSQIRLRRQAEQLNQKSQEVRALRSQINSLQEQFKQLQQMGNLGQICVNISRVLNQPAVFLHRSLVKTRSHVDNLLRLVRAYQLLAPARPEIEAITTDIDLELLNQDLLRLLDNMLVEAAQTREIIAALGLFNPGLLNDRLDINECLDTLLPLLQPLLNDWEITIVRNYQPLPPLRCNPPDLAQLLLSVLQHVISYLSQVEQPRQIHLSSHLTSPQLVSLMFAPCGDDPVLSLAQEMVSRCKGQLNLVNHSLEIILPVGV